MVPFIDRLRPLIDLREQVVSFPPQPVITEDNLVVNIDTVIYFQVTDAKAATYEIANYIQAIEQLTVTTLRNVIGGMDLERTLTSREEINAALRGVLDEATGKWGIRVNRVELKAIEPPTSIQDSMEKQMRADRDKRAAILTAEGFRQSAILTAEGEKQSRSCGPRVDAQAAVAARRGRGPGHPHGLRGDPRRRPGPEAARLPVPPDAAEDRPGRRQQALDRARARSATPSRASAPCSGAAAATEPRRPGLSARRLRRRSAVRLVGGELAGEARAPASTYQSAWL